MFDLVLENVINWLRGVIRRDMAAVLLSKLLTRHDMSETLHEFLEWCWERLEFVRTAESNSMCDTLRSVSSAGICQ